MSSRNWRFLGGHDDNLSDEINSTVQKSAHNVIALDWMKDTPAGAEPWARGVSTLRVGHALACWYCNNRGRQVFSFCGGGLLPDPSAQRSKVRQKTGDSVLVLPREHAQGTSTYPVLCLSVSHSRVIAYYVKSVLLWVVSQPNLKRPKSLNVSKRHGLCLNRLFFNFPQEKQDDDGEGGSCRASLLHPKR